MNNNHLDDRDWSNSLIKTETLDIEHTISGRLKELLDLKKKTRSAIHKQPI